MVVVSEEFAVGYGGGGVLFLVQKSEKKIGMSVWVGCDLNEMRKRKEKKVKENQENIYEEVN